MNSSKVWYLFIMLASALILFLLSNLLELSILKTVSYFLLVLAFFFSVYEVLKASREVQK